MRIVRSLPHAVRTVETAWIPMPDGARLAARLWIPEGAERAPVPAILECLPYRRRDHTRGTDQRNMTYFAGHGYACVRLDLRGSGDSDGVLEDEYLERELQDCLEVLRWVAAQPWCTGRVGVFGISWSGFNGLQLAARRPPELGAVVSLCSTDDRYTDDVHYMGGCLLGDNLSWASVMFAYNSLPPDPDVVGDRWREMWKQRLEGSGLWLETWLRHPYRDEYWKHGSVCEDLSAIECPVLLASGWADGYSNAVFRMLAGLQGPRRGLIGPWSHLYPHTGIPGPAIGFLQECLRWWGEHLAGEDTGIEDEPVLRVWMQDSVTPHPSYEHRPGRWVAEWQWPSPEIEERRLVLATGKLTDPGTSGAAPAEPPLTLESPLSVGLFAGKWCSYAAAPDLPHDQREEDGGALTFDSAPLDAPVEILGAPVAELELSANRSVAMVAVRLSDVAPNGAATRVTYGLLNLTHRDGHERPTPLEPGERYTVRVQLNDIAQRFPEGHRIRLAVSTSYFPLAWPPPEPVMLTVHPGASSLRLPTRAPRASDEALRTFDEPEQAPPLRTTVLRPSRYEWTVIRDLAEDVSTLRVVKDDGKRRIEELDLEVADATTEWYSYRRGDFGSVKGEVLAIRSLRRGDWSIRTETRTVLTSDASRFLLHATLDAFEGGRRICSKDWSLAIPRGNI